MWAAWVSAQNRPAILSQRHGDWPWPLRYVPRSWTAWLSAAKPGRLLGKANRDGSLDLPENGEFVLALSRDWGLRAASLLCAGLLASLMPWTALLFWLSCNLYVAVTLPGGRHFRYGARYDYSDGYYQIPAIALGKKVR